MKYTKPPLSIQEQIKLLKSRGLTFNDEKRACHYLSNISFYRLRAYTYSFQDNADQNHPFTTKVSFEDIIDLYVFDRKLRILVFNAIEKIEVALRTKIIYEFSTRYGSHWHEDKNMFRLPHYYRNFRNTLHDELNRSRETFIDHYLGKYSYPDTPPAWMSLEIISFGALSRLFSDLKKCPAKHKVTKEFGLPKPELLEKWLHSISSVRNICAHHGRLWNRRFTIKAPLPRNTRFPFLKSVEIDNSKLYFQLSILNYITRIISPNSSFVHNLKNLLKSYPDVEIKAMGFPEDWEEEGLWK